MAALSLSLTPSLTLLRFPLPHRRAIPLPPRLFSLPLRCISVSTPTAIAVELPEVDVPEGGTKREEEGEGEQVQLPRFPVPNLTVKEKKELASYAHSLGKKLKYQQVGKSGVTPAVAASFVQTLEANELLKLKVHGNCPEEFQKVIRLLEESTGSVAVGHIGRSVILYRPSLSKMKKEETQKDGFSDRKTRSFKKPKTTSYKPAKPSNSFKVGRSRRVPRASSSRNP